MAAVDTILSDYPTELKNVIVERPNWTIAEALFYKYINCFTGGISFKDADYLERLPSNETAEEFNFRQNLSVYDNHCKRVINNYVYKIFSRPPVRQGLEVEIESLVDFRDYNNRMVSVDCFFKYVLTYLLVYGEVYIVIMVMLLIMIVMWFIQIWLICDNRAKIFKLTEDVLWLVKRNDHTSPFTRDSSIDRKRKRR